jgi:hypothetical protein
MTGWLIAGGFLAYWYLLKKGTTQSLVTSIRNEFSGFSAVNKAGLATGAVQDPGVHDSYPGVSVDIFGIRSAEPGSSVNLASSLTPTAAVPSRLGTVRARTGSATVPVGALREPYPITSQLAIPGSYRRM